MHARLVLICGVVLAVFAGPRQACAFDLTAIEDELMDLMGQVDEADEYSEAGLASKAESLREQVATDLAGLYSSLNEADAPDADVLRRKVAMQLGPLLCALEREDDGQRFMAIALTLNPNEQERQRIERELSTCPLAESPVQPTSLDLAESAGSSDEEFVLDWHDESSSLDQRQGESLPTPVDRAVVTRPTPRPQAPPARPQPTPRTIPEPRHLDRDKKGEKVAASGAVIALLGAAAVGGTWYYYQETPTMQPETWYALQAGNAAGWVLAGVGGVMFISGIGMQVQAGPPGYRPFGR